MNLKAPFPYIGGKSRAAAAIWARIGDPVNYVVPFMGSLPDLLLRPAPDENSPRTRIETVNDADCYLANAWRAIQRDPEAVVRYCDWPVSEADLESRHKYLVGLRRMEPEVPGRYRKHPALEGAYLDGYRGSHPTYADAFRERMKADPDYFDPKFAGWWVWGACCWIGSGWCPDALADRLTRKLPDIGGHAGGSGRGVHQSSGPTQKRPKLSGGNPESGALGAGIHANGPPRKRPLAATENGSNTGGDYPGVHSLSGPATVWLQKPYLSSHGRGANQALEGHRPQLADAFARGRGVHGHDSAETCRERREWLLAWFGALSDRLRTVRVCCGDWSRVCGSDSTTTRLGVTGILLDPPYAHSVPRMHAWLKYLNFSGDPPPPDKASNRARHLYGNDASQDVDRLVAEVHQYCLERGRDPMFRIALCGLQGEHDALEREGWSVLPWKAGGGYGNRNKAGNANAARERIWFSPGCEAPVQRPDGTLPGQMSLFADEPREASTP